MRLTPPLLALALIIAPTLANSDPGMLAFPTTADGRQVLAVDLHTHSVFSDGRVWPDIRVEEAAREGLAALAITEHLEWQPHGADIPNPDRNRAFEIARERAQGSNLVVINGAEITRGITIGHINAVFLDDANSLMTAEPRSASTPEGFRSLSDISPADAEVQGMQALREARRQGAFIFLNHPSWVGLSPDGRGQLSSFQSNAIAAGLIDGVEVGNGGRYSVDGFRIALEHDLAILGTSDVHGLTAWDYAQPGDALVPGGKGARTVTLVLSRHNNTDAIQAALSARHTIALSENQLFARETELAPLLASALSFSVGKRLESYAGESSVHRVTIDNIAPIPLLLENRSPRVFADSTNVIIVPARGHIDLDIAQLTDPDAFTSLPVAVLNAFTGPEQPLVMRIERMASKQNN